MSFDAASVAVRFPVIWISPGAVGSLQVMPVILLTVALSQPSDMLAETVTGTSSWFGGERMLGLTVKAWIMGAVAATVNETPAELLFPAWSVTVMVIR